MLRRVRQVNLIIIQTDGQTDIQIDGQTNIQTDGQTHIQTDGETDKLPYAQTYSHTEA